MASSKRLGFFWGDDKLTLVEFEKNTPVQVVHSPLASKANKASPFSSNLTEEIQITAILKKTLQDNRISGGTFYVSLPMKEIILRSFVIPAVKQDDLPNAIKFEAKRYIPFEIQDLSYVFHTIPFEEGRVKKLQVIFFAARKEVLARYERIFTQVNIDFIYSEPYIVSLTKALLFRKEIKPTDHIAFLDLNRNLGRICFIDQGIPQFIREFPVSAQSEEAESQETLNLKIVNEVGNSFDFYGRQFSGEGIDQVLVSSDFAGQDLIDALGAELKFKISKFSPVINTTTGGPSNDMDAVYAMGACVVPPIESLLKFNFIGDKTPKPNVAVLILTALKPYKEIIFALIMCLVFLTGVHIFFQVQLKFVQNQYDRLVSKEGNYLNIPQDSVQTELQQNIDKLSQYKSIRVNSDVSNIILKVAAHLPPGTLLSEFDIAYNQGGPNPVASANAAQVSIDIQGRVVIGDSNVQIGVVNQMFADFKKDKKLAKYINNVNLVSLNHQEFNGKEVTQFVFHFS